MSVSTFEELKEHYGHKIECVVYGDADDPANVAIECEDCGLVILDFDCPPRVADDPWEDKNWVKWHERRIKCTK